VSITKYLDDLEARIEAGVEEELERQWVDFLQGRSAGPIFSPRRSEAQKPGIDWPEISINKAIADDEAMLLSQFAACSEKLASGSGAFLCVRCNYGTSIIPSLFGVKLFIMDEVHNTLPTSWPMAGGKEAIRELVKQGVPNLDQALGEKTFSVGRQFQSIRQSYPNIGRYVHLYHPDLQGPMDICEVIWGSSLFLDVVDEPALVKDFLSLITETYSAFMREWDKIAVSDSAWSVHWGFAHEGRIMLRDDSAMNFSPEMFEEFILPFDSQLLRELGGGGLHFCGKGDHYMHLAAAMPGLRAVNMSQPEYNNMETIYRQTVDQGLPLLGFSREAAEQALDSGRDLRGLVHCW